MTEILPTGDLAPLIRENTMLSFQKAREVGCHGIELDVHLSADGVPVVIHDEQVDRTTDGSGWVGELSLRSCGSWTLPAGFAAWRDPTESLRCRKCWNGAKQPGCG